MNTALEEGRRDFNRLVRELPVGVYRTTMEGEVIEANPAALKLLGCRSLEELRNGHAQDFMLDPVLRARHHKSLENRASSIEEFQIERPDGVDMWIRDEVHIVTDDNDEPQYMDGVLVNISRQRRAETAQAAFLASMSHEIRTPLTGILGFATILYEELADEQKEIAEHITHSGERLLKTINAILELARLETDVVEFTIDRVDIAQAMRDAVNSFRPLARRKGLEIHCDADETCVIHTDRRRVHRIFNALLSNAVTFTTEGAIHTTLACEDDQVIIRVRDTGPGIHPEFLPYVFEAFRQERVSTTERRQGSGLGLAITKRLVDRMHGTVSVESEVGRGTTFTLKIPDLD